jgi:molybdopterin converting factor small subunit
MAAVHIPALLRDATAGHAWVEAPGATVGDVVAAVETIYPGLRGRLIRDGRLLPGFAIAVDGEICPLGLREPVRDDSEIQFLTAISGGY